MGQCEKLKAKLQKRGTKSAKRHLKQLSGREKQYRRNVNHCISKKLVAKAKDAGRMLVLENLKGVRNQTTVRKAQRRRHNSWGFGQLRNFIEYKAKLAGVPLALVNPRETEGEGQRRTGPDTESDPQTHRTTLAELQEDRPNTHPQTARPPQKQQRPEGSYDDP